MINLSDYDLTPILDGEELEFYNNGCPVPYNATSEQWALKSKIKSKAIEAIERGKLKPIEREAFVFGKAPYVVSDCMAGGVNGLKSMADGKNYDSKSAYYRSLKEKGLVVLGNDAPTKAKGPEATINEKELKQDIATAIQQLGG